MTVRTLVDTPVFEDGVYQLETIDLLEGGDEGKTNIPMQQLANRTSALRQALLLEHTADGLHYAASIKPKMAGSIVNADVATNAAIAESKIDTGLVGAIRPLGLGVYSSTEELVDDVPSALVNGPAVETMSDTLIGYHDAATQAAHPDITTELDTLEQSVRSRLHQLMVAHALDTDTTTQYFSGFVVDFATSEDVKASGSTGYTYDDSGHILSPSVGASAAVLFDCGSGAITQADLKGTAATFIVDVSNTSGHFNVAVPTDVKAGCGIQINGTRYVITSISSNGSTTSSVVFSGTLVAGTYAIQGVYGTTYSANKLMLSSTGSTVASGVYYAGICPSLDASTWRYLSSATTTSTAPSGSAMYYLLSVDGGTTYRTWNGSAWQDIARDNSGTWQYYSTGGSAWVDMASYFNTAEHAVRLAVQSAVAGSIAMTPAILAGLQNTSLPTSFTGNASLAVILYSSAATTAPSFTSLQFTRQEKSPGMTAILTTPTSFSTTESPRYAYVVCLVKPGVDTSALSYNTNFSVYVSKDGETTWNKVTLSLDTYTYGSLGYYVVGGEVALPLTAGTTLATKVVTSYNLDCDIDLVGCFIY